LRDRLANPFRYGGVDPRYDEEIEQGDTIYIEDVLDHIDLPRYD